MTAYVDYAYYKDTFLGNVVSAADFPRLALRASIYIKAVTHGKATADNAVKDAACVAAEMIQQIDTENYGKVKASESVSDWSVNYVKPQNMSTDEKVRLMNAIEPYFYGTGLLYAGIDFPTTDNTTGAIK